ncbi:hypothetical protein Droror1_Dr00002593 [Drosera rotundifolia]
MSARFEEGIVKGMKALVMAAVLGKGELRWRWLRRNVKELGDGHRSGSGPGSDIPVPDPRTPNRSPSLPRSPPGNFFPLPSPPQTGNGDPRGDSGNPIP